MRFKIKVRVTRRFFVETKGMVQNFVKWANISIGTTFSQNKNGKTCVS